MTLSVLIEEPFLYSMFVPNDCQQIRTAYNDIIIGFIKISRVPWILHVTRRSPLTFICL